MFLTWEDAKKRYPNRWVVFKNPQFKDRFNMKLIGGEFVLTADDQEELFRSIPEDIGEHTARHTREDDEFATFAFNY